MKRLTLTLGLLALAAVLAACSGASAAPASSPPPPAGSPSGDTVAVVAKDIKFTTPAVSVKAGAAVHRSPSTTRTAPRTTSRSRMPSGAKVFKGEIVIEPEGRPTRSRPSPPARTPSSARSIPT